MNRLVAGIDEAGRGPLAGPVVAAAVILGRAAQIRGIADSKTLQPGARTRLAALICAAAASYGIGWADPAEIDALDILRATHLAMRRAVLALALPPEHLLIDGNRLPALSGLGREMSAEAIVGGDATVAAIGAASILAKTARDEYMERAAALYPQYEFARHKGYPTELHRRLLRRHGPSPLHRRSFAPVAAAAGAHS